MTWNESSKRRTSRTSPELPLVAACDYVHLVTVAEVAFRKNMPAWEQSLHGGRLISVNHDGRVLVGRATELVGRASQDEVRWFWTLKPVDGGEAISVPESAHVLAYGQSSYRNLVGWHLGEALWKEAYRLHPPEQMSSYVTARVVLIGTGDDETLRQQLPALAAAVAKWCPDGIIGDDVKAATRVALRARLAPLSEAGMRCACELLQITFGGDAETYRKTWHS